MRYLACLLAIPLLLGVSACRNLDDSATMKPGQTAHKFYRERKQILSADYLLFLPQGYADDASKRWPLILFLHGAGERGTNVWAVAKHGPPSIDTTISNFPFIVVSPQCPDGKMWSNDLLLALLDDITNKYSVDAHRIYLTGLSMGGFGTWSLGLQHPDIFAAMAPICGGCDYLTALFALGGTNAEAQAAKSLPVWAFHGAKDPVVPVEETERMVALLKKRGVAEVKMTIYPDALHNCWTQTYANPELFTWFLQHTRP